MAELLHLQQYRKGIDFETLFFFFFCVDLADTPVVTDFKKKKTSKAFTIVLPSVWMMYAASEAGEKWA